MNDDWIEWTWTEEKPYPETLETMVQTRHKGGFETMTPTSVGWWAHEEHDINSSWKPIDQWSKITHYRVVSS